jgi:hypothetical protein
MGIDAAQLDAINSHGNGLRVVFTRHGDRWRHVVQRIAGEQTTVLLESLEGSTSDQWPASPPFQELSQETLPDGRNVLFLVGRCGTSHWSASIEAVTAPQQLIFDIACRHSRAPDRLGSKYTVVAEGCAIDALLGNCDAGAITPAEIATRLPTTTRWKYRIQ